MCRRRQAVREPDHDCAAVGSGIRLSRRCLPAGLAGRDEGAEHRGGDGLGVDGTERAERTDARPAARAGRRRGRPRALPRGRVVGGCSAVNATFALRGSPADYDAWAAAGVHGWSFADLLPAFTPLEHDLDFRSQPYHGDVGPTPVRRYTGGEQSMLAAAAATALHSAG